MKKPRSGYERINTAGRSVTRLMLRGLWVLLMVLYLMIALPFSWNYILYTAYAYTPAEDAGGRIKLLLATGHDYHALNFVRLYPLERSRAFLEGVAAAAPALSPLYYFEFSRRAALLGETQDAVFWSLLAQMRLRYDVMRCADDKVLALAEMMRASLTPLPVKKELAEHPASFDAGVHRMLDWDQAHPPQSAPDWLCNMAGKLRPGHTIALQPEERWPLMHQSLRQATEELLKERSIAPKKD